MKMNLPRNATAPVIALAIFISGCAADKPAAPSKPVPAKSKEAQPGLNDGSRPPSVGMTKAQVLQRYGRPVHTSVSARGEVWGYAFNTIEAHDFIPVYGALTKRSRGGSIIFGSDGRVKDFNWGETNPSAGTFWGR